MPSTSRRFALSLAAVLALALGLLLPALGWSQSAPLAPVPEAMTRALTSAEPPARVAEGFGVAPMASLADARTGAADQLAALEAWNRAGRLPIRDGIVRPLPVVRAVTFGPALASQAAGLHAGGAFVQANAGSTVWGAAVTVDGAWRLRLHLADLHLPAGARLWVYGDDGETAGPFGAELAYQGGLWTPSVAGPTIRLEVELDRSDLQAAAPYRFTVDQVAQIFELDAAGAPRLTPAPQAVDSSCLVDVSCVGTGTFPVVDLASKGVAQVEFIIGPSVAECSGGLLNLAAGAAPGTPFPFLTANHCISTQSEASSLEATWDFKTPTCNGTPPAIGSLPKSNGATLLATGGSSDFTLLELQNLPPGRVALGWDASQATLPSGTVLHRISYPAPDSFFDLRSQQYTRYRVKTGANRVLCGPTEEGANTDDPTLFHHSVYLQGGTFGGSSGAPLMTGDGHVVGQLFGACGDPETVHDGCSTANDELDGNFSHSFQAMSAFLGIMPSNELGRWLSTPELPGFEFQLRITAGSPVTGMAESDCIAETLCASGALAGRPEVFVKVIGPRPNGFLWVQISRFTPSEVEVWVHQLSSDDVQYYDLPSVGANADDVPGRQDRTAFLP